MINKWWHANPRYRSDQDLFELTGLARWDFDRLVVLLELLWSEANKKRLDAERLGPRKRIPGAGRPSIDFPSRLFVVLVFLRSDATYRRMQADYGVGKDLICRSVAGVCELIPTLGITRSDGSVILNEDGLHELLAEMADPSDEDEPGSVSGAVIVDGTFTQVGRPAGWEQQKLLYNFHRHLHCLVFQTCVDHSGDLLWLSGHYPGSTHDLTALHKSILSTLLKSTGVPFIGDKGYQGVRERLELDVNQKVFLPAKKPRNGDLEKTDKIINKAIAQIRIQVEHAHARLKSWRILRHYRGRHPRFTNIIQSIGVLITFSLRK